MISIRKTVTDLERQEELDRREELYNTVVDCYASAMEAANRYVVDVDPSFTTEFQKHLAALEQKVREARSTEKFRIVQSSFRGELRDYRDKTAECLKKLRQDLKSASAAMATFAESVATTGANHRDEVSHQLVQLEDSTKSDCITEIRQSISSAVESIHSSVQNMERSNQLVIAQLEDEIRLLHKQIESERRAAFTDGASGAWNRQKMDEKIDNLVRQNQPFCLLLVCVRGLRRIESQHSRSVVEGMFKALINRFSALAGEDSVIGRWSSDQFAAIVSIEPSAAIALSGETARKLSGPYAVQENGMSHKVSVQATAGVIEYQAGMGSEKFHKKLEQLLSAVGGPA